MECLCSLENYSDICNFHTKIKKRINVNIKRQSLFMDDLRIMYILKRKILFQAERIYIKTVRVKMEFQLLLGTSTCAINLE